MKMKTAVPGILVGLVLIGFGMYYASRRTSVMTTQTTTPSTSQVVVARTPLVITDVEKEEIKNDRQYTMNTPLIVDAPALTGAINRYIQNTNIEFDSIEYSNPKNREQRYEIVYQYKIIRNDADYCTILIQSYMSTGGAHGLPAFTIFTFDRATESFVPRSKILSHYTKTDLEKDVYDFVMKKYAPSLDERILFEDDVVKEGIRDVLTTGNSIGIGTEGVYIRFPVYSIAPYVVGEIVVEL